jgi:hypothetical protein
MTWRAWLKTERLIPSVTILVAFAAEILGLFGVVVSSGFRGLPSIMFRIITNDDQVEDDQATKVVGKGANFIGFGAKLAEEAFQQVG